MMRSIPKQLLFKIIFSSISLGMLVISCIFLQGLPKIVLLLSIIIFASLAVVIANLDYHRNESFFKALVVISALCSIVLIGYIILSRTGVLDKIQDAETLIALIRGTRHWGVIVFILLVVLEILVLPIPGAVTAFIATKLFGALLGCVYIIVGTLIGSIICFTLGKVFGKQLVSWMIGKEKTEKYADLLANKGKALFIAMMIFPFFPDDILCMVAGITNMTYKYFITVITLARPVMIILLCYFAEGTIIPFSGWGIPIWIAIFAIILAVVIIFGRIKDNLNSNAKIKKNKKRATENRSKK